jgi:hypothetical protein
MDQAALANAAQHSLLPLPLPSLHQPAHWGGSWHCWRQLLHHMLMLQSSKL